MACATWLRRDYLLRQGIHPDESACDHDPEHCPPTPGAGVTVHDPTDTTKGRS